jgi:hypothetical protein
MERERVRLFRIRAHHRNSARNSLAEHLDLGVQPAWPLFR